MSKLWTARHWFLVRQRCVGRIGLMQSNRRWSPKADSIAYSRIAVALCYSDDDTKFAKLHSICICEMEMNLSNCSKTVCIWKYFSHLNVLFVSYWCMHTSQWYMPAPLSHRSRQLKWTYCKLPLHWHGDMNLKTVNIVWMFLWNLKKKTIFISEIRTQI